MNPAEAAPRYYKLFRNPGIIGEVSDSTRKRRRRDARRSVIEEERNVVSSDEEICEGHNVRRRTDEASNRRISDQPQKDKNCRNNNPRRHSNSSENEADTKYQNQIGSANDSYIEMDHNEGDVFVGSVINAPVSESYSSANEIKIDSTDESSYRGDSYSSSDENGDDEQPALLERERRQEEYEEEEERPEFQPFDLNFMCTPLFEGSNTTVGETMFLIETFAFRHNLNKVGLQDLLHILNIVIGPNILPNTIHLWDKQFLHMFKAIEYHLYCPNCGKYLCQIKIRQKRRQKILCEKCNTSTPNNLGNGNFFATVDLKEQIKTFLEDPEIYIPLRENEQNRTQQEGDEYIRDVYDGITYRNLKRPGNILHNLNNFTFNFNLDGASFFTSSDTSCWPLELSINELPFKLRNKKLILVGVWFGPKSQNIETFVKPFCNDMKELANEGISWTDAEGRTTVSKVIPFCCCVDSVARRKIMNNIQFNGKFGCPWCYNPGRSVVGEENTRAWKYPFLDQLYKERTEVEVRQQMNEAEEKRKIIKGFKGRSPLFNAPHFNVLWGFPPDYLHNVLLRVLLGILFKLWFSTPGKEYYIGGPRCLTELDSNLRSIKPPDHIHRLPTSINKRSKWKASQGKSFLLHYGIPCLTGILPDVFLKHFALLVEGISLLLTFKISHNDLEKCERILDRFVAEFEVLYGEHNMTVNVHSISHLVTTVRMCGPLCTFSTFPYESYIFVLKQCTHSSRGVAIQISEKIAKKDSLSLLARELNVSDRVMTLAKKISSSHSLNEGQRVHDECIVLGRGTSTKLSNEEKILLQRNGIHEECAVKYERIIVRGIKYASSSYKRSVGRDNSFVELNDESFTEVSSIIVVNNQCLLFAKPLLTEVVQYERVTLTQIRKIVVRNEDRMKIVYPANLVGTCVHIEIKKQNVKQARYLSRLPNVLEVQ